MHGILPVQEGNGGVRFQRIFLVIGNDTLPCIRRLCHKSESGENAAVIGFLHILCIAAIDGRNLHLVCLFFECQRCGDFRSGHTLIVVEGIFRCFCLLRS